MLINADFKALEIVCAFWLSQDEIGIQEIRNGDDIHSHNQTVLALPDRIYAKIFIFRLIYGGTAYAYTIDPDFQGISTNEVFWQERIDSFYSKYKGMHKWHDTIFKTAMLTGRLEMPTGRVYEFKPFTNKVGHLDWPRTQILNYPVQGLGADFMVIIRNLFKQKVSNLGLPFKPMIATIHDSLLLDVPASYTETMCKLLQETWNVFPQTFSSIFNVDFDLPTRVEIKYGPNLAQMQLYQG